MQAVGIGDFFALNLNIGVIMLLIPVDKSSLV